MTIRLLVGLGNPGTAYEATRHNAGFWWIDGVAHRLKASLHSDRAYKALVARISLTRSAQEGGPLWLMQPQTFMNLSGQSVAALARFFKIAPQEILVVHDELDIPPGTLRLKQGGSPGGHNGLKSIDAELGSKEYWRLRIGIGHPGVKAEVIDYVLRKPPQEERALIEGSIARSIGSLDQLLAAQMDKAMMALHAKPKASSPAPVVATVRQQPSSAPVKGEPSP
jgi:peptidyl-tRNA hydrolase, PTH1 family